MTTPDKRKKPEAPDKATLTPLESTKVTGFGRAATYKMLRAGTLPPIRVGSRYYVPLVALERWMETCGGQVQA